MLGLLFGIAGGLGGWALGQALDAKRVSNQSVDGALSEEKGAVDNPAPTVKKPKVKKLNQKVDKKTDDGTINTEES